MAKYTVTIDIWRELAKQVSVEVYADDSDAAEADAAVFVHQLIEENGINFEVAGCDVLVVDVACEGESRTAPRLVAAEADNVPSMQKASELGMEDVIRMMLSGELELTADPDDTWVESSVDSADAVVLTMDLPTHSEAYRASKTPDKGEYRASKPREKKFDTPPRKTYGISSARRQAPRLYSEYEE